MGGSRGGRGGGAGSPDPPPPPPREKSQKYRVSLQYWSGSAFNFGPLSARQRNAISMAFRWRAEDGPLIVVFVGSSPKKKKQQQLKQQ